MKNDDEQKVKDESEKKRRSRRGLKVAEGSL